MTYANGVEGNGTTITFGTSALTLKVKTLTPPSMSRESRDMTYLGSDWEDAMPGVVKRLGEASLVCIADPDQMDALKTLIGAARETITITQANSNGATTGKKTAFTGFCTNVEPGELANDNTQEVTLTIKAVGEPTETDSV